MASSSKPTKNLTIDIAKAIAILLVVYGHVIEHSMAPFGEDFFLNPVFKSLYTFHMPLFFFISGYLMANSLKRHPPAEVFNSRYKSLLVPFIFLACSGALVICIMDLIFGKSGQGDVLKVLADQVVFKPQVWFLWVLFVISTLIVLSKKLEARLGLFIFAVIYVLVLIIPLSDTASLYEIKWFYLFYLAGYGINRSAVRLPSAGGKVTAGIISLILFSWLVSLWRENDYIYVNKMHFTSFADLGPLAYRYLIGSLGILLAFIVAAQLSRTKAARALEVVGVYSLDIYILQMFLVEGLYPRLVYKFNFHLDLNSPLILFFVAPVIALVFTGVCMLISKYLIRINPLLNRFILGGRA